MCRGDGEKTSCWAFAVFFYPASEAPVVAGLCARRGEADWIDGTAAGPTQL